MRYLLDTNIAIAIINRDERVRPKLEAVPPSSLRISVITLAELRFGVAKSSQSRRAKANLRHFIGKVGVVPFDADATQQYGKLRAQLEKKGKPIGPLDTLIAAHALALHWTLVTNNLGEFQRVPKLAVETWLSP